MLKNVEEEREILIWQAEINVPQIIAFQGRLDTFSGIIELR